MKSTIKKTSASRVKLWVHRLSVIALCSFFFIYGLGVGHYKWPPFYALLEAKAAVNNLLKPKPSAYLGQADTERYAWELLNRTAAYQPRDGAGGLVFNSKLYLIGGWNPNDNQNFPRITSNDVWESADGVHWKQIKPNTFSNHYFDSTSDWEGRHTAGYVVFNNEMWIVGGDPNQGYHQHDIWKSSDGVNWAPVSLAKPPWAPRALMSVLTFEDKIYVLGGQTFDGAFTSKENTNTTFYQDIYHTTDGVNWEHVMPEGKTWLPRSYAGFVEFKGQLWVIGGFVYEGSVMKDRVYYGDVWSSVDGGHSWNLVTDKAPWAAGGGGFTYHNVVVFDNKIWIIAGAKQGIGDTNEVWFSDDGKAWQQIESPPITPTHATTLFVYNNRLIIGAGHHMNQEVWALNIKE